MKRKLSFGGDTNDVLMALEGPQQKTVLSVLIPQLTFAPSERAVNWPSGAKSSAKMPVPLPASPVENTNSYAPQSMVLSVRMPQNPT